MRFEANNDNTNANGEKWFGAIQKIFFQFQIQRKIFSTKEVLHISGVLKLVNEQKQSY